MGNDFISKLEHSALPTQEEINGIREIRAQLGDNNVFEIALFALNFGKMLGKQEERRKGKEKKMILEVI